ncbi:hypothetical protein WJX73_002723 [Symbiochloris irregularis]|uniref:Eukaryotic translation initiation factor 3 subunit F n=1 Tax=Symbiochloris irregularis TaxID=706552 RepID=A0AAW1PCR1_9CHLO
MPPAPLLSSAANVTVKIQPTVLLNICDAYIRRSESQDRVIGTLLGTVEGNTIEVKECYAVPFNENQEQVAMDINHHQSLLGLHQKVIQKEVVVGWFATGIALSGSDAVINDFYTKECAHPVHLTVDTSLQDNKMAINVYMARVLSLGGKPLATEFQAVEHEILSAELERLGEEHKGQTKHVTEIDTLRRSIAQLEQALAGTSSYVEDVVSGRRKGDAYIGRYLADTVAAVPQLTPQVLSQVCADTSQDMVLLMYLSSLVRTQLALADKLGTASLPLL